LGQRSGEIEIAGRLHHPQADSFAGAIVEAAASSAPRFAQKCASNTVENPDPGDQRARIPRGQSKP
jgi:hypothetical protein